MKTETARIEAFSDGVFAIAITLLILEIKIPPASEPRLDLALLHQWPSYFAFLLSFLFIGVMWINHHRLFTHIRRSDDTLLLLNLLLMLGVTVVPFPTSLIAQHLMGPGARSAAAVYNGTYILIAIFFNLLWRYALSHGLLDHTVDADSARAITRQYAVGPLLYLICLMLVWKSAVLSLAFNAALAIFFAIPPKHAAKIVHKVE